MFSYLFQLFLDQWIWSITWGLQQMLVTIGALSILMWFFLRYTIIRSFMLAATSQVVALIAVSLIVYGVLVTIGGVTYKPLNEYYHISYTILEAASIQGIAYSFLQLCFFKLCDISFQVSDLLVVFTIVTGNMMGALWAHWFLPPLL